MIVSRRCGFTLLELSIVLVVIALLVGGVLVGRDLLAAAMLRSQVAQIDRFKAAARTFQLKHGGLPGDLTGSTGLGFATRAGGRGRGDGNGIIESGINGGHTQSGEIRLFWNDLSTASLIEGTYAGTDCNNWGASPAPACTLVSDPSSVMPRGKLPETFVVVNSDGVYNYFQVYGPVLEILAGISKLSYENNWTDPMAYPDDRWGSKMTRAFTGTQSLAVDGKMDDGSPSGGGVQASIAETTGGTWEVVRDYPRPVQFPAAVWWVAPCVAADGTYQPGDLPACSLRFRW